MEEVIVNVDAAGVVTVEAKGVRGQGCAALTKGIEEAIGRTSADAKKPEFFQPAGQANGQQQRANNHRG